MGLVELTFSVYAATFSISFYGFSLKCINFNRSTYVILCFVVEDLPEA